MADQVSPEPDGLTPSQRHMKLVENQEQSLLDTTRELAGKQMYLEMIRSNRRSDPDEVYQASNNFREAERKFETVKHDLIDMHKTAIRLIAQEKSEAGEL